MTNITKSYLAYGYRKNGKSKIYAILFFFELDQTFIIFWQRTKSIFILTVYAENGNRVKNNNYQSQGFLRLSLHTPYQSLKEAFK